MDNNTAERAIRTIALGRKTTSSLDHPRVAAPPRAR
ncbi:transposase [uncultured Tateyamaria sp.]|nr:transposase [uncultured Tateyamaria sp.]